VKTVNGREETISDHEEGRFPSFTPAFLSSTGKGHRPPLLCVQMAYHPKAPLSLPCARVSPQFRREQMADVASLQRQLDGYQQSYVKLQQNRSKLLDIQYENELVQKDLEKLKANTPVYQSVGPALIPKTHEEARVAVRDKLAFIKKQMDAIDSQMRDLEGKMLEVNRRRIEASKN